MCMGKSHRLAAGLAWVLICPAEPIPLMGGALLAFSAGGGRFSPDMDLKLGIAHRGTTHMIEIPMVFLLVGAACALLGLPIWWVPAAIGVSWGSHDLLDIFSGHRGVPSFLLRRRLTVPDWAWIHTGGWFERRILTPLLYVFLVITAVISILSLFLFPREGL